MEERDETLERANLGVEAESFLVSPLGRHIQARAEAEIDEAVVLLIDADPEDVKLGRSIRFKIEVAQGILTWLAEAVNDGRQAALELRQQDDSQTG